MRYHNVTRETARDPNGTIRLAIRPTQVTCMFQQPSPRVLYDQITNAGRVAAAVSAAQPCEEAS